MRLVALIVALLLVVLTPERVQAHASLVDSTPVDGALLKAAPATVELVFNEPVEALSLLLVSPQGDTVQLDGGRAATDKLRLSVPPGLGQGSHLLSWRVVSADGHPVGGSILFSIGKASGGDGAALQAAASQITAANPGALVLARWLMLTGLVVGVAGTLYLLGGANQTAARRVVEVALAVGLIAAVATVGLEGLEAHGLTLGSFWRPLTWRTGWRVRQAVTAELVIGAILVAAVAGRLAYRQAGIWLAVLAAVVGAAGLMASGHAVTAPPSWVVQPALALHLGSVMLWAGALVTLAFAALRPNGALDGLRAFSDRAPLVFGMLIATGLVLALVQAGTIAALVGTAYGQLLLAKVMLVTLVAGIAAYNRYRLTQPALAGDGRARQRLGRAIAAEAMIAIVILGIVATWRVTPPPRALAQMREPRFQIHMHGTEAMASVIIQPARAGPVRIVIEPKTPDLAPLAVKEVALSLTGETPGMEPLRRAARQTGNTWEIDGLTIPSAGRWRVRVELLIDDFERTGLDAVIVVRE